MNNSQKGAIFVLLSAFGFGIMPALALFAYRSGISPSTMLLCRFVAATLLLLPFRYRTIRQAKLTLADLLILLFLGGIGYTLTSNFYFLSLRYLPSSMASLLLYTYPIMVAIISSLVDREAPSVKVIVAMLISFAGLIVMLGASTGGAGMNGVLLALGAAALYSVYIVVGNRALRRTSPEVASFFVCLFAILGVLVFGLCQGSISFHFGAQAWIFIAGLTLLSTIMAINLFFRGLRLLGPTRSSILSMTEPVFTVLLAILLFHDRLTPIQWIGGAAILGGAVVVTQASGRKRAQTDEPAVPLAS
jgi:drug/metabolite transporter (DMT)-like permease